jgi:hypothetical protein
MRLIWVMPIEGCAGSSRWRHVRLLKAVQMLAAREECPAPTSGSVEAGAEVSGDPIGGRSAGGTSRPAA